MHPFQLPGAARQSVVRHSAVDGKGLAGPCASSASLYGRTRRPYPECSCSVRQLPGPWPIDRPHPSGAKYSALLPPRCTAGRDGRTPNAAARSASCRALGRSIGRHSSRAAVPTTTAGAAIAAGAARAGATAVAAGATLAAGGAGAAIPAVPPFPPPPPVPPSPPVPPEPVPLPLPPVGGDGFGFVGAGGNGGNAGTGVRG